MKVPRSFEEISTISIQMTEGKFAATVVISYEDNKKAEFTIERGDYGAKQIIEEIYECIEKQIKAPMKEIA